MIPITAATPIASQIQSGMLRCRLPTPSHENKSPIRRTMNPRIRSGNDGPALRPE